MPSAPATAAPASAVPSHAGTNAFAAFTALAPTSLPMRNAFKSLSPAETSPFFFDEDQNVLPPVDTPALVPDDGDLSTLTSPIWGSVSLFPEHDPLLAAAAAATATAPAQAAPLCPRTISPIELSLPLPSFDAPAAPAQQPQPQPAAASSKKRFYPAFDIDDTLTLGSNSASSSTAAVPVIKDPRPPTKRQRSSGSQQPSGSAAARFTGTRNTSIALLDLDAPTQKRDYAGPPSKTSKRAVPAAAARKVAALRAHAEEAGVELGQEIEQSIEEKRRQNTVAARKSRQRKAEHLQSLEDAVRALQERQEQLELEVQVWTRRALAAGWSEDMRPE